jgi:hypothetical protein
MKELVVLVADGQQKAVIETLLEKRYHSFGIRPLLNHKNFEVFAHPRKDNGVYGEASQLLSLYVDKCEYALVLVDEEWEGSPGSSQIQEEIQTSLNQSGWENRSATIVIAPELEIWVWSSSNEVAQILGKTWEDIRQIGESKKYWEQGAVKPHRPKELMDEVLRQTRKHRSASLFSRLAENVSLKRCSDPSFLELKQKLQEWFPPQ